MYDIQTSGKYLIIVVTKEDEGKNQQLSFAFHPLMNRLFKNQNKTKCPLENVSHTSCPQNGQ